MSSQPREPDSGARLLAQLVHKGVVDAQSAQEAIRSGDPRAFLDRESLVSAQQWDQWLDSDFGARPRLSRYRIDELLGEGGQARVFRALDRQSEETVALKILRPELAGTPRARQAFVAEAKLLLQLEHPHIVAGRRVAKEGDVVFCAMELLDGECLQDVLEREGRLEESQALGAVADVAEALDYLHRRGLVHRDVKPGNIVRTRSGRSVLIDLGFATRSGTEAGGAGDTTAGTVHYISPEQARGNAGLDVRADIYSLGATLYHLCTGSLPFGGEDDREVLAKQVLESLSGGRIRAMGLSSQLHYFIEKMMAKDKEIRFQDPAQLAAELRAHLARSAGTEKGRGGVRRRRRRWL